MAQANSFAKDHPDGFASCKEESPAGFSNNSVGANSQSPTFFSELVINFEVDDDNVFLDSALADANSSLLPGTRRSLAKVRKPTPRYCPPLYLATLIRAGTHS